MLHPHPSTGPLRGQVLAAGEKENLNIFTPLYAPEPSAARPGAFFMLDPFSLLVYPT